MVVRVMEKDLSILLFVPLRNGNNILLEFIQFHKARFFKHGIPPGITSGLPSLHILCIMNYLKATINYNKTCSFQLYRNFYSLADFILFSAPLNSFTFLLQFVSILLINDKKCINSKTYPLIIIAVFQNLNTLSSFDSVMFPKSRSGFV